MKNETKTLDLIAPIEIEGKEPVKTVEINKPNSGHLRGISLSKLFEMDVETMIEVLPRISNLTPRDCLNLDPVDYAPVFTTIAGFFVNVDSQPE